MEIRREPRGSSSHFSRPSDAILSIDCQVFALNEFNCDIKKQCCTDKIDEFQKSLDVYSVLLKKELFW